MASKFVSEDGKYNQKVEDSNTQAKNKFGNPERPIKDSGKHSYNQKLGKPVDSKKKLG